MPGVAPISPLLPPDPSLPFANLIHWDCRLDDRSFHPSPLVHHPPLLYLALPVVQQLWTHISVGPCVTPNSPLAVVAALGDGVELLRPVVTLVSHGLLMASWGPLPVFLHLRAAASFLVSF